MFPSIAFLLATIAIVIIIICYILLLVKLKLTDESSEISKLLQETYEDLSAQRRTELLKKYKEERIKEYLQKKTQQSESS